MAGRDGTHAGRNWADNPAAPLALLVLIEGLTFLAERSAGVARPHFVNADYGLVLLIVMGVRRRAPRAAYAVALFGLLLAVFVDGFFAASRPIFAGVMRLSDYIAFIDLWPWRALTPWIVGSVAACALIAYPASKASRGALTLAGVLIALFIGDHLAQGVTLPGGRPLDIAASSTRNLVRSYIALVPSGIELFAPFSGPTMDTTLAAQPPRRILSVGMESLGVYDDPADQANLLDALLTPAQARYRVAVSGVHAFRGLTLQGEMRELCGMLLSGAARSSADIAKLRNCLPNRLARAGYRTVGLHGNPARFYFRRTAYPGMGFQRSVFIEDLPGRPLCRPDVFNGVCDEAMFREALSVFAEPGPAFVHLMTLNAHPPFPKNDPAPCARRSKAVRAVCSYDLLERDSLGRLGHALATTPFPPDTVIVFGDHAPVFSGYASLSDRSGVVPYLVLERR